MGKRIVSLLLAFVLVLSLAPQVRAEGSLPEIDAISATVSNVLIQGQQSEVQKLEVGGQLVDVEVYDISTLEPQITIHYANQSPESYTYSELEAVTGIAPSMDVIWGNSAQGGVWEADGNNNLLQIDWNGFHCTARVSVTENPVESVSMSIDQVYYIGVDSELMSTWDTATDSEISWMGYNPMYFGSDATVTINYKDGDPQVVAVGDLDKLFEQGPQFFYGPEQESWTAGSHQITGRFLGCDFTVDMMLVNSPVQSFSIVTNGYFTEGMTTELWDPATGEMYYGYDPSQLVSQVDMVLPQGTTSYSLQDANEAFSRSMEFVTDQYSNPWGLGVHDVTAQFMGKEYTFRVEVQADPVKSISVASPISMTQGVDTYLWDIDGTASYIYDIANINPTVTINYSDGTSLTAPWDQIAAHTGYDVCHVKDMVETASWKPGNTYDWEVSFMGHVCTVKVQVLANPVQKIEVADVSIKYSQGEKQPYGWDEATQQQLFFRLYNLSCLDFPVIVTYTDGTKETLNYGALVEKSQSTYIDLYQDPTSPWETGKTYTVTLNSMGHAVDFKATVVDDRVKTLTVTPTKPLYEGISNWTTSLHATSPSIHVTFNDGTTLTGDWSLYSELLFSREVEYGIEGGDEYGQLPVGNHTGYMIIDGVKATFTVEVLANTIKHIQILPNYPLVEGVHSYTVSYPDEQGNERPFPYYNTCNLSCVYKVTYIDGSVKTFSNDYELYELYGEYPSPFISQSPDNYLKVGENKVKVMIYGEEYENTITVIKNPIKSISAVYTKDLVEGVDWEYHEIWDEVLGEWVTGEPAYYPYWENVLLTVTYENGTTELLDCDSQFFGSSVLDLCDASEIISDQDTAPWTAGKHKWTVTALGHTFDIPVTVVKNEIVKLSAKATEELVEGWYEMAYGDNVWYYDLWYSMPQVTATFTDGTSKTYTYAELCEAFPSTHFISDIPVGTPGTKTAVLDVNGVQCSFDVVVKPNPIKSITAVPSQTLKEGYLGTVSLYYPGYGDCTFQNYVEADTVPVYTITYNDGTTEVLYGDHQVFEKYTVYPFYHVTHGPNDPYTIGKHTVQIELLGHTLDYTFEIVKDTNPLEKITAKPVGTLYENVYPYGYTYYYYGHLIELTLHYKDGTTKTGIAESILPSTSRLTVEYSDSQDLGEKWGVGKHKVTVSYKNLETETEIEVVANPYTGVAIANGKDGLTVTLTNKSGVKEVYTATAFRRMSEVRTACYGTLVTDKGSFFVTFRLQNGKIVYMDMMGLQSNSLDTDAWLRKQMETELVGDLPQIQLDCGTGSLSDLALSDTDKIQGFTRVWLTAEDVSGTLSEADQALLDTELVKLSNYISGLLLDLTVYKSDGQSNQKVSTLSKAVSITIPLDNIDGTGKVFKILRIHNGKVEELECTYDAATNSIVFRTDRFSTYSMVYTDAAVTPPADSGSAPATPTPTTPATPAAPSTNPNTGDATPVGLFFGLALVSLSALIALWFVGCKKRTV